ncbi:hypothetical protein [Paenibacillus sp. PSB04]|uniref:hypothetical protein n=1 Tax=Paenibacillus sp. PSB04 TaxID=2866810 RepID=UPI0021F16083|nr:hypothetical protein [Paenibacillus sp. PSB04]UYO05500.1 hypothetical protein K2F33_06045 [Paenibacillus sp. PSB04]
MTLQSLFNNYLNIKFNRGFELDHTEGFKYGLFEDGSAELFFADHDDEPFVEWADALQPKDPRYTANPDWSPLLSGYFPDLDVYDEQILYFLLYTINSTTSIASPHPYRAMNDFMKHYCFFQLGQLTDAARLNEVQKEQLRDFFFFFYLYAHPVNEETLYGFSFRGRDLVHTKTGIRVERYFSLYHDYYCDKHDEYKDRWLITPHEIQADKHLTLELLRSIEGKSSRLLMPSEEGFETVLRLINDVDELLRMHSEHQTTFFDLLRDALLDAGTNPYREYGFRMLLQNYVCYILYFQFDNIHDLVDHLKDTPLACGKIVNMLFADAIFIQKIMRQHRIDIAEYQDVTVFFGEETREMYL